jgi:hypothetical protein
MSRNYRIPEFALAYFLKLLILMARWLDGLIACLPVGTVEFTISEPNHQTIKQSNNFIKTQRT